jgi:hypothetical protein
MEKDDLSEKIAKLEFQNDQLVAELEYVDSLLRAVGFADGLASVKSAARELATLDDMDAHRFEDGLPDDPPGLDAA